jgi:putative hydrolase of the HAD superfamily
MERPALIFDFGNVIAHFDYTRACTRLGSRFGLSGEELLARVRARGLDTALKRYETGRITGHDFSTTIRSLAGLEGVTHDEFAEAWVDIFWLNEPVAALVGSLRRRGYTLVLGSNTNELHASKFRHQFAATLAHFDRLVLSYEVGHLKPSAEFFVACARAAERPESSCVFIDDLAENVAGAEAVGMRGIVYRDPKSLKAELERVGIAARYE